MNNDPAHRRESPGTDDASTDTVARLMSLAGPRAEIEMNRQSRVHDRVRQEWLRTTRKKRTLRWAGPVAIAASIILVFMINVRSPDAPLPRIGEISFVANENGQSGFVTGDAVFAGDVLETGGDSGVSITLTGDISLRVAARTSLRFDQADEITLFRGQVYADSGDQIYRDRHITIHTDAGSATDIGTRFSVYFVAGQLQVAVREGRVDVNTAQETITADAGDMLSIDTDDNISIDEVTPYDESWDWASALAPEFDIEDKTLMEFLKWAARETGKELVFSTDALRMSAMGTELFGSVRGFTPAEAVESVLATTNFEFRVDEQSIEIIE